MPKDKDKLPPSARRMKPDPAARRFGADMERLKNQREERIKRLKQEEAERQLKRK